MLRAIVCTGRGDATVTPLVNFARYCECGRIASYRVTVRQFSAYGEAQPANLYLCGMCYRMWQSVENAGDTMETSPSYLDVKPLPKRVDLLLAELRQLLLRSPLLERGGQIKIHVSEKRGTLKLELPSEIKEY